MAPPHGAMGCLRYVILVFLDHTHLLFLNLLLDTGPCPEFIKLEFSIKLKIKRND